jgi:hypothetical protein
MSREPKFEAGIRHGQPGSLEYTRPALYPNYSPETDDQRKRIVSPTMSFRTEVPLVRSFLRMLRLLERADFEQVIAFSGPKLGPAIKRGEIMDVTTLIEAFEKDWEGPIPMGGLKAVLVYKHGEGVRAKLKVGGSKVTKVVVRVKGTILMSHWNELGWRVRKKFKVEV